MIVRVYLKSHLFHLPRKQDDLTQLIIERFYQNKKLVKAAIQKLYPIIKIENENLKIEKDTNIFLLNLYLLVLQERGELQDLEYLQESINNEWLLQKIAEKTGLNLYEKSFDEIESIVIEHLYKKEKENDTLSILENVEYSIKWVQKANNLLERS